MATDPNDYSGMLKWMKNTAGELGFNPQRKESAMVDKAMNNPIINAKEGTHTLNIIDESMSGMMLSELISG